MTTALDIVQAALHDSGIVGVGQTPLAEDSNKALLRLNWMIAEWNRKRWFIWHLVDLSITSTGATSYSIGPTAANIALTLRPDRLEDAFIRQLVTSPPNQVDYPLRIIEAREEYDRIRLKGLVSFPNCIFYDSAYPNGILYTYPVPQASIYQLHVVVKDVLLQFATLTTVLIPSDEYASAMHWNLCQRLRTAYRLPPDPGINALCKNSLNVLRKANVQIPQLNLPTFLLRPGRYNILSDSNY